MRVILIFMKFMFKLQRFCQTFYKGEWISIYIFIYVTFHIKNNQKLMFDVILHRLRLIVTRLIVIVIIF